MKIRTDFVTNSSSSSYIIAKRLIVPKGRYPGESIPIEVAHRINGENAAYIYNVGGNYAIDADLLKLFAKTISKLDFVENIVSPEVAQLASDFWRDEAAVINVLDNPEGWRVEEHNWDKVAEQGATCFIDAYMQYDLHFPVPYPADPRESDEDETPRRLMRYYDITHNATGYTFFNKYVRSVAVWLFNSEETYFHNRNKYRHTWEKQRAEFFGQAKEKLSASAGSGKVDPILETMARKALFPIFVGRAPATSEFPNFPTDIWLLALNAERTLVLDAYSVEILELENWLAKYEIPGYQGSLAKEIADYMAAFSEGKKFYNSKSRYDAGLFEEFERYHQSAAKSKMWQAMAAQRAKQKAEEMEFAAVEFDDTIDQLDVDELADDGFADDEFEDDVTIDTPIEDLDFSVRTYQCLKHADLLTVGDIIIKTEAELLRVRNLGRKSYEELTAKLSRLGYPLKESGQ